jgi:hypothetical protein
LTGSALTWGDVLGCLHGVVVFFLVLVSPGYCLGWVCDLFGFRSRPAGERMAWGIALSFAVVPVVAVMAAKYGSFSAVCWVAAMCGVGSLGVVGWEALRRPKGFSSSWSRAGVVLAAAWVVVVVAALVDVGVGNHLYLSVTVYDHALRSAFVDAVLRTGVPPANPLYWTGHAAPMRYYYFWYVVTAVAARLGGVTARQSIVASVVWAGFGLAAITALYCRHFLGESISEANFLRRRWSRVSLALALLAVTGLDILPAIAKALFRLPADADMEWWSGDQVTSWLDSVIWVPHHVAALICCLFGFLLVWMSKELSVARRGGCALIAGLAFGSAFGLSIWVPLGFAMVLLLWIAWVMASQPESRMRVPVALVAGLIAVLVLLPYLAELRSAPADVAGTSHFLQFGIRRIIDPDALLAFGWFAELARVHPVVAGSVARLILLVPGYFVELGFFGVILIAVVLSARRLKLDESARTSLFFVAATLIITTFLRSTVISSNDFGWRAMLIGQFFLLLLAVRWFEGAFGELSRRVRGVVLAMAWIGVAGTVYQAVALRFYLPVEERLGRPEQSGLAEYAMAMRRGFDAMDRQIPKAAIVQFDTGQPSDYFLYAQILQVRRQAANALPMCASAFGGEATACRAIEQSIGRLFVPVRGAALSATEAQAECGRLGVSYLVATRWDGVWADPNGWVWKLPTIIDSGQIRVVGCDATVK